MRLGTVIRKWRNMSELGIRAVAKDMGVSHGTLSRVERDEPMDAVTLIKVFRWLLTDTPKDKTK